MKRCLPFVAFALLTSCKPAATNPAPSPPAAEPEPAPAQAVEPAPPAVEPTPSLGPPSVEADTNPAPTRPAGGLVLRPGTTSVRAGQRVDVEIFNAGDQPFRFHHPGGSSGCAAFRWVVFLTAADGTRWSTDTPPHQPRACTSVMVMPRDFEFAAGEVAETVAIDTSRRYYVHAEPSPAKRPAPAQQPGVPLPAGQYELAITGAGVELRGSVTVEP